MENEINFNTVFTVQLTEEGLNIHNDYVRNFTTRLREYLELPEAEVKKTESFLLSQINESREMTEPLWKLMQIFGPKVHHAMEIPFEKNKLKFKR